MKSLVQRLIDLGVITADKETVETYSWQKTQLSRLDVRRAINRQPAWLSQTSVDSTQKKKIILDYYHLLFTITKYDVALIIFLLEYKFQIFIPTKSGSLEEIKSSTELAVKLPLIEILPKAQVEDELSSNNKEASDYFVVDHAVRLRLLNELKLYLSYSVEHPTNSYELTLTPDRCAALDEQKIQTLCSIANEGGFNSISCDMNNSNSQYLFTWSNSFSPPSI